MVRTYEAPHEILDAAKVSRIIEAFRAGRPVPPVVVTGDTALTGTHRIAAHRKAWAEWNGRAEGWETDEPTLDAVEVSGEDYLAACGSLGIGHHGETRDFNLFAAALYAATEDETLKAALSDQRGEYEDWTKSDFARYTGN